jgi:hypothetical protein
LAILEPAERIVDAYAVNKIECHDRKKKQVRDLDGARASIPHRPPYSSTS